MKTPSRFFHIMSVVAAVAFASVAVAQPPPGGPGAPFGPAPGGPGPRLGPGPRGSVLNLLVPPPPPDYYHHRHYRSSSNAGDSSVTQVQSALKKRGYYSGAIDGDAGSGTRAAIRGFREDNGLMSSTRIDGTLLRALGL